MTTFNYKTMSRNFHDEDVDENDDHEIISVDTKQFFK